MRYDPPVLHPDPKRIAFFDGMGEEHARLRFACANCGADADLPLLSFVDAAHARFRALGEDDRLRIVRLFDCPLGEFDGRVCIRAHDDTSPYFGIVNCGACGRRHLLYVGFGEIQPARYRATLHGLATVAGDDPSAGEAMSALSLAIPLAGGRVLLRFRDGALRLTEVLFRERLRRFAAAAWGIAWGEREGLSVDALQAVSRPVSAAVQDWLLGCRSHPPDARISAPRECGFVLRPFEQAPFLLYESIAGGIGGGGGQATLTLPQLRAVDDWKALIEESGCGWAVDALARAPDDTAAIQAIAAAAAMRGEPLLDPFQGAPEASLPEASSSDAEAFPAAGTGDAEPDPESHAQTSIGWFAAPDEPPLYFVSEARTSRALADEIATVVERMRDGRERDGAVGADAILFVSDGTQFKLHAYWYDPEAGESLGEWRYTIVLRHLFDDETFDSSDLEDMCYFAADAYVGESAPESLRVFFRYEYGDDIIPIERFEW